MKMKNLHITNFMYLKQSTYKYKETIRSVVVVAADD